jgi:hypothetical protein
MIYEEPLENGPGKVVGFSSPRCLDILKKSKVWMGDGTFKIAESTLFRQVFIVIGKAETGLTIPCAYFLLPTKEYQCYRQMFDCLKSLNLDPPDYFFCDLELAIIKSVRDVFPETEIRCCDAHFKRAIRNQIGEKGLLELYQNDADFQTFIRYLWGLTLVPVEQIVHVWETYILPLIDDKGDDNFDDFLTYFDTTYIGAKNLRTQVRRQPRYAYTLWSKYSAINDKGGDGITTTNSNEGYNHAISLSLPQKCNIWVLIKQFMTEDGLVAIKVRDAVIGTESHSSRVTKLAKRREELYRVVSRFHEMEHDEYFELLVTYYNDTFMM